MQDLHRAEDATVCTVSCQNTSRISRAHCFNGCAGSHAVSMYLGLLRFVIVCSFERAHPPGTNHVCHDLHMLIAGCTSHAFDAAHQGSCKLLPLTKHSRSSAGPAVASATSASLQHIVYIQRITLYATSSHTHTYDCVLSCVRLHGLTCTSTERTRCSRSSESHHCCAAHALAASIVWLA
jgi:hypothetical protein